MKRKTRPMLDLKNIYAAQRILVGIEVMAMIKKGQMQTSEGNQKYLADEGNTGEPPTNVVLVAMANKTDRTVWVMMRDQQDFNALFR